MTTNERTISKNVFIGICLLTTVLGTCIGALFTYGCLLPYLSVEQKKQNKFWTRQGNTLTCYYKNVTYKYFWNETSRTLVLSGGSEKSLYWDTYFAMFVLGGNKYYSTSTTTYTYYNCSIQFGDD